MTTLDLVNHPETHSSTSDSDRAVFDPCARFRAVQFAELTDDELGRWVELRASNPSLDSPYYHPEFVAAVAAIRQDVMVIVGYHGDNVPTSFLPLQLDKRTSRPAGWPACDFQGPICAPGMDYDIRAALTACGISSYEFDHLREGVPAFEPWILARQPSPYIDIAGGLDGYMSRARGSGKHKIREAGRLRRKAEREHGPVRFLVHSADPALLDQVIAHKRRQYASTGARDYFATDEHLQFLHNLLGRQSAEFGGVLSAVYAGDHLVAAHFGLRAGQVLHWWFPAYDPKFSRLDPGWIVLRGVIEAAPDYGLSRIDLGRGTDEWKRRAATGQQIVCQGAVIRSPLRRRTTAVRRIALDALKASPVAPALRRAVQYTRRRRR